MTDRFLQASARLAARAVVPSCDWADLVDLSDDDAHDCSALDAVTLLEIYYYAPCTPIPCDFAPAAVTAYYRRLKRDVDALTAFVDAIKPTGPIDIVATRSSLADTLAELRDRLAVLLYSDAEVNVQKGADPTARNSRPDLKPKQPVADRRHRPAAPAFSTPLYAALRRPAAASSQASRSSSRPSVRALAADRDATWRSTDRRPAMQRRSERL
jgi:hypothetical protein